MIAAFDVAASSSLATHLLVAESGETMPFPEALSHE
jgi:hypothetical protein